MTVDRVLLVGEQLRRDVPGGIGTYVRGLVSGLRALGATEEIPELSLYASRPGRGGDSLAALGVPLVTSALPAPALTRAWDHGLLDVPRGFDVVHASSLLTPPCRRARLVVTVHDLAWRHQPDAYHRRGRRWHEDALRRALARADAVVVPSGPVADEVTAAGAEAAAVHVVGHGSDHLPAPDEPGARAVLERLGVDGGYLLSVGTLEPRKNLTRVIEAYGRARRDLPERWPLVVVGPRGWRGVDAMTGDLGAAADVLLAGAVPDATLADLYRRARLLVYVPLLEGFGFPPLEAMAAGTPVIASPLPSTGNAALEVDPREVEAIAEAMLRVATDDDLRRQLTERGLAWAASQTWAASARAHARLWVSLA